MIGSKRERAEEAMRHSWFPVARVADLNAPQPATLLGEKLVVYRDGSGQVAVQARRCPHRGGDLARGEVKHESIACPYHGWEFSSADGHCSRIPSLEDQCDIPGKAAVPSYPAVQRYGHVWTVLEEPLTDLYDLTEWHDVDFEWLAGPALDSPVGVGVSIENFRDVAHFPFVHKASMGPSPEVVEPLNVIRKGLDVLMQIPLEAGDGEWAGDGDCIMYYHCIAPGFASITYDYANLGKRIVTGFPSPVDYEHVTIFWSVANQIGYKGRSVQECLKIEEMVFREDLPIIAYLEPKEIPWDAEYQEFSVPADLFTLNYRRAFHELMNRVEANGNVAAAH